MNKAEIKIQLAGYRPEVYADDDPQIAEALMRAHADPELQEWLEGEIAFDRQFAAALSCVPVDRAGVKGLLDHDRDRVSSRKIRRFPTRIILAAAALVMIGGFLVKFLLFPAAVQFPTVESVTIPEFRDQMAYFANQRFSLDKRTPDFDVSRAWLGERDSPVYSETPDSIIRYKGMGCKVIDWHGRKVSLVCFRNDDRDIVHLFVIEAADLSPEAVAKLGEMRRLRGLETQGWEDGQLVYLFVGAKPDVSLSGLL